MLLLGLILLALARAADFDPSVLSRQYNLTCHELLHWIGTEKHYSNDKRKELFELAHLGTSHCGGKSPVLSISSVSYDGKSRRYKQSDARCTDHLRKAVVFLSNFSINNNYSHFLHALLRLFCALIDAELITWRNNRFERTANITLLLDNNLKVDERKLTWLRSIVGPEGNLIWLQEIKTNECVSADTLIYGSGCAFLLPPEKWFGYPGCRSREVLPAFRAYMRQELGGLSRLPVVTSDLTESMMVGFSVRRSTSETGLRSIVNLEGLQTHLRRRKRLSYQIQNVTFEVLGVAETVAAMSEMHIFVSVHGAGMTNMFFMNAGAAVLELVPWPLCNCRSSDFFYGTGGYYHGSAIALGLRHYSICIDSADVTLHSRAKKARSGVRCSWKQLHAVESLVVDPYRLTSVIRNIERDMVFGGLISLSKPIIEINPHANG